uniref:Macaca fascicularis brain cDNA clone: QmoA-12334, similar to human microtubule-associated protein 1B (MAP1B), transcriptvariant 1, mRNA, RefSeq: NM_005909.2 n=1 Tax=Macaca fascicularis TaxID=9541 RepID=I7GKY0_MACFA|nr:unnamed protein product [Macaca fascicularis]
MVSICSSMADRRENPASGSSSDT